jgi:hypothetical protein
MAATSRSTCTRMFAPYPTAPSHCKPLLGLEWSRRQLGVGVSPHENRGQRKQQRRRTEAGLGATSSTAKPARAERPDGTFARLGAAQVSFDTMLDSKNKLADGTERLNEF